MNVFFRHYKVKRNFGGRERRMQEWSEYVGRVSKYARLVASKERQLAAVDDTRQPERESSVYQTIHNLEIPNLAVTVSGQISVLFSWDGLNCTVYGT